MANELGIGPQDIPRSKHDWVELGAAIVLGLATVTSTWCAYEAKAWNARQINLMLQVARTNTHGIEETTRAMNLVVIDVVTFMQFAIARQRGEASSEQFLHERMRPEFAQAVDDWLGQVTPGQLMPNGTPFTLPSYTLPDAQAKRLELRDQSAQHAEEASRCNEISATYILLTVLLATSLFFMGIAPRFDARQVRLSLFFVGVAVWSISACGAASMPVAIAWNMPAVDAHKVP